MSRRAPRLDANQAAIVTALRQRLWSVQSLAGVGDGCPDLLIGRHGVNLLLEIKDGTAPARQQRLTPAEAAWLTSWRGQAAVVHSVDEAVHYAEHYLLRRGQ